MSALPVPRQRLHGWGGTAPSSASVQRLERADDAGRAIVAVPARGLVARGLGRSYGDAAQNAGGLVLDATGLGAIELDPDLGLVRCGAGVSLDDVLRVVVPAGWFLPVSPGTRYVTVGGAVASDIHGKNHHVAGSFAEHTSRVELVDGEGARRRLSRHDDSELFWATAGGMGLTGVIVEATFQLDPIESSTVLVDTERAADLDELLTALAAAEARAPFAVAWIDLLARGRAKGRGVVTSGRFASVADARDPADPLAYRPHRLPAPQLRPPGLLNRATMAAFNQAWFRRAPRWPSRTRGTIASFFHPLDAVGGWNTLYGRRGFLQWQMVVPLAAEDTLRTCVALLAEARAPSFLTVLKRLRAANPGPLSFPLAGWTLTVDLPAASADRDLLDRLDRLVVEAGGRIYLAKDSRVDPVLIPAMYPRLDEWRAVRDAADPHRRFTSVLDRRLNLTRPR